MAVMSAVELRTALGADEALQGRIDSIREAALTRINRHAQSAPTEIKNEALLLYAAWIYQSGAQARNVFPTDQEGPPINVSRAFLLSGAQGLLTPWRVPRAGATVLP